MQIDVNTRHYKKAFVRYLRQGTPIEISLKAEEQQVLYYIWQTAGDEKVRTSHAANSGKIFAWDKPPPTGHPGTEPGCRCVAIPYIAPQRVIYDPPIEPVYPELLLLPATRLARIFGGLLRTVRNEENTSLNTAQANNLIRFDRKLPKDAGKIEILNAGTGKKIFQADVPARNIPGSYARYQKIIDKSGNTLSYTKTTYAPDGKIIHVKVK
jgi:SPP1 gp7 family putative phage head morphogenesis protein